MGWGLEVEVEWGGVGVRDVCTLLVFTVFLVVLVCESLLVYMYCGGVGGGGDRGGRCVTVDAVLHEEAAGFTATNSFTSSVVNTQASSFFL